MRYLLLIILSITSLNTTLAQIHEIGVYAGGSNFIGDVGATKYIAPNKPAFGGIYKWNRSRRHSYRVSGIFSTLEANDNDSNDPSRIERNFKFKNSIVEISAGMEFTFFEYNLHAGTPQSTPYLYTGIVFTKKDNFYLDSQGIKVLDESSFVYGIPMVLGYKFSLYKKIILALEIGARYTFSDNIDGSIPASGDKSIGFGNINNKDWYTFTGATLTYTFGKNPCFCNY